MDGFIEGTTDWDGPREATLVGDMVKEKDIDDVAEDLRLLLDCLLLPALSLSSIIFFLNALVVFEANAPPSSCRI